MDENFFAYEFGQMGAPDDGGGALHYGTPDVERPALVGGGGRGGGRGRGRGGSGEHGEANDGNNHPRPGGAPAVRAPTLAEVLARLPETDRATIDGMITKRLCCEGVEQAPAYAPRLSATEAVRLARVHVRTSLINRMRQNNQPDAGAATATNNDDVPVRGGVNVGGAGADEAEGGGPDMALVPRTRRTRGERPDVNETAACRLLLASDCVDGAAVLATVGQAM